MRGWGTRWKDGSGGISNGDTMVLTGIGGADGALIAKNGGRSMYQGTVGGYGRMTRKRKRGKKRSNGYESAKANIVGLCRRNCFRWRLSSAARAFFTSTHSTVTLARGDLG
jgi:hypothetical protein